MTAEFKGFDDIDPTFDEDLERSKDAVLLVKAHLTADGWTVTIPPRHQRGEVDQGDILATKIGSSVVKRFEVKHRNFAWTSRDDFPHPDIWFANTHQLNPTPPVEAYIMVSAPMTHYAAIHPWTKKFWTQHEVNTRGRGRTQHVVACPREHLAIGKLRD